MATGLSFREQVRRMLPSWLLDRPSIGKTFAFRLIYSIILILDASMQAAIEGVRAAFPESGPATALPYHGRDRRIPRGPFQGDSYYAAQLVDWLTYWRAAGHAYALTKALQAFFAPGAPRVRVVTRAGVWWTLEDGAISFYRSSPNNWDWDSVTHPALSTQWWDFWVIVYPPHVDTDDLWGDPGVWGDAPKAFGSDIESEHVESTRVLVRQFKGVHARCVCLILSYDDTAFDPSATLGDPGLPDGYWGRWSKRVAGAAVPARREDCRYWEV